MHAIDYSLYYISDEITLSKEDHTSKDVTKVLRILKIGLRLNDFREKSQSSRSWCTRRKNVDFKTRICELLWAKKGMPLKISDQKLSTIKNVPNMTEYQCLSALTMYVKTKVLYEISCIYFINHKVRFRLLKKDYMCSECGEICFDCWTLKSLQIGS